MYTISTMGTHAMVCNIGGQVEMQNENHKNVLRTEFALRRLELCSDGSRYCRSSHQETVMHQVNQYRESRGDIIS